MAKKLNVSMVISWYVNELIAKLHNAYPHTERSGIGRVVKRQGYYEVIDVRFPKQTNTSGNTEMTDEWVNELLEDIFNTTPEQMGEWKLRLHSHHTMWCFRSGTDETAKHWFNDGQQDYRWSIVTAYNTAGKIDYLCALNVFKPVNVEFKVTTKAETINYSEYLKEHMQDYATYEKALDKLRQEKESKLGEVTGDYFPTPEEIGQLVAIFNVEDNEENRQQCYNLLAKDTKNKQTANIKAIENHYDAAAEELLSYFNGDVFSVKLKELSDNIQTASFPNHYQNGWRWDPARQAWIYGEEHTQRPDIPGSRADEPGPRDAPLFDPEDDAKYTNHTCQWKVFSSFQNHYGDYYD